MFRSPTKVVPSGGDGGGYGERRGSTGWEHGLRASDDDDDHDDWDGTSSPSAAVHDHKFGASPTKHAHVGVEALRLRREQIRAAGEATGALVSPSKRVVSGPEAAAFRMPPVVDPREWAAARARRRDDAHLLKRRRSFERMQLEMAKRKVLADITGDRRAAEGLGDGWGSTSTPGGLKAKVWDTDVANAARCLVAEQQTKAACAAVVAAAAAAAWGAAAAAEAAARRAAAAADEAQAPLREQIASLQRAAGLQALKGRRERAADKAGLNQLQVELESAQETLTSSNAELDAATAALDAARSALGARAGGLHAELEAEKKRAAWLAEKLAAAERAAAQQAQAAQAAQAELAELAQKKKGGCAVM